MLFKADDQNWESQEQNWGDVTSLFDGCSRILKADLEGLEVLENDEWDMSIDAVWNGLTVRLYLVNSEWVIHGIIAEVEWPVTEEK